MIDLNLLIVFDTLMKERSVTRTGNRLGKTQSAISNALKRLRENLDDPLFIRTPNGLLPTPRALELHVAVEKFVDLANQITQQVDHFNPKTAKANFAVGAPDRLSLPVLLPFLESLRNTAPGININVRTADRDHAVRLLITQEVDMAVGWFEQLPPVISYQPAFSEQLVCLLRKDHPLLDPGHVVRLESILAFPHLVVTSGGDKTAVFDAMLSKMGLRRNALTTLSNFTMVPPMLMNSDLVGVFTHRTADYFASHFELTTHPLPIDIEPIQHQLVWHKRYDADRMHRWLREQLWQHCQAEDSLRTA